MCPRDLLSTFRMFADFLSTFLAAAGPSVNFCQLSVHSWDLSLNFLYGRGNAHQLSVHLRDLPSTAVNISCVRKNYQKFSMHLPDLPSTFVNCSASSAPSVNFYQLSVHLRDLPSTSVNFHVAAGPSVNFPCIRGTFHQHSVCRRKFL